MLITRVFQDVRHSHLTLRKLDCTAWDLNRTARDIKSYKFTPRSRNTLRHILWKKNDLNRKTYILWRAAKKKLG